MPYVEIPVNDFPKDKNTYFPLLLGKSKGMKVLMTDADLFDYPNSFLTYSDKNTLKATFHPYPLAVEMMSDRASKVVKDADYVAKTSAKRSFPWRLLIITEKDAHLVESNLVYQLSRPNKLENTNWIKPGRVSWEWWNASNLHGVNFEAGFNTESYKYYIDFAAENGLEYIMLDEGWSYSTKDLSKPNPNLDLKELISYGKDRNIDIILWTTWSTLNKQWFVLDSFKEWGIVSIKIDFMDPTDQWMDG